MRIVGKLPQLEVLKLSDNAFHGEQWEVAEEGFPRLKFLLLDNVCIMYWRASSDHFPCLEQHFLKDCHFLDSIPLEFADIITLALIDTKECPQSVGDSAKQIQQDIQDNYGSSIKVYTRDLVHFSSTSQEEDGDDGGGGDDDDDDNDDDNNKRCLTSLTDDMELNQLCLECLSTT